MPLRIFKSVLMKGAFFQPILTIILVVLLAALIFQFAGSRKNSGNNDVYREVTRKVTFDESVNKFLNNSYVIYTQGSLLIKNGEEPISSLKPNEDQSNPDKVINATENKYDDLFFYVDKGVVKRIDFKPYGKNETLFFSNKNEIVYINNTNREYTKYPEPDPSDQKSKALYDSTRQVFYDLMPLISLVKDYKEGRFTPVERATNIYSGKWKHQIFTSDEVTEVFLETDPATGLFKSFNVTHSFSTYPSQIFFNFKEQPMENLQNIPSGYKEISINSAYKPKSS